MLKTAKRAGTLALLTAALVGTSVASPAFAANPEVQVFAFCKADGSYSFNAIGSGFPPVEQQNIYSVATKYKIGGGKTTYTEGHGELFSSSSGYISTPTYFSSADSTNESVSVKVVIGGVAGTDAANCD